MKEAYEKAAQGMESVTPTTLAPGMRIHHFADTGNPKGYFTGRWWVGFSPFEALEQYSTSRGVPLPLAARQCLAIDQTYTARLDILVTVVLKQALSAWSGTPKTQVVTRSPASARVSLRPSKTITQLCIPGLDQKSPTNPALMIWQSAFGNQTCQRLEGDAGT